jgi:hypothetical protein
MIEVYTLKSSYLELAKCLSSIFYLLFFFFPPALVVRLFLRMSGVLIVLAVDTGRRRKIRSGKVSYSVNLIMHCSLHIEDKIQGYDSKKNKQIGLNGDCCQGDCHT